MLIFKINIPNISVKILEDIFYKIKLKKIPNQE